MKHAASAVLALLIGCQGTDSGQTALDAHSTSDALSSPGARGPVVLTERALELHRSALVLDGHNDLPIQMRSRADNDFDQLDLAAPQPALHTDIERLRAGGLNAQFWSIYVSASTEDSGTALLETMAQIDLVHRMVERYPETFELAATADDVERIRRAGRIACMLGVEGGYSIDSSLPVLRLFHTLGVRYMTLTHSDTTAWCDSATDEPEHGGLSPFGEEVVREMNRLGMLVDISHVSVEAMEDALRVSAAPVIASHSCADAVAPHPRNVPDHVLAALADNGGVVMVNFYSGFVVPEGARIMRSAFDVSRELKAEHGDDVEGYRAAMRAWREANPIPSGSVHDVVDHIDHIARVAGVEHVGLGSDYDGVGQLPEQLEDVSCYPYITQELLNRGYTEQEVRGILGLNALRALREAERVAAELQS